MEEEVAESGRGRVESKYLLSDRVVVKTRVLVTGSLLTRDYYT